MALRLTADKLETRVRRRVEARSDEIVTSLEVLEAIDDVLNEISVSNRINKESHGLRQLTITPAEFTKVEDGVWEYTLPEYVLDVKLMEGHYAGRNETLTIAQAHLQERDAGRKTDSFGLPVWMWSAREHPGTFQIRGRVSALSSVTVWFVRAWPPLFYGTLAAGSASTVTLDTAMTGEIVPRDGIYDDTEIEVIADTSTPGNVGLRARLSDFDGSTLQANKTGAWVANNTTEVSMIAPVGVEHLPYIIEEVAVLLWSSWGQTDMIFQAAERRERTRRAFLQSITNRDSSEPKRLFNSRIGRG